MKYDPIKRGLGKFFNRKPLLRKLFYRLLDLLLLRAWHVKRELKLWGRNHKGKNKVLDAGSGFGQYTYFMASRWKHREINAIDVKEDQIEDCTHFFEKIGLKNVIFELGDLTGYVRDGYYDLILSVDVMEHILEDVEVFKNFYRSMSAGGKLIISTPSDQGGSDVHDHEEDSFIDEHVRDGYGIDEIKEKLTEAGFSDIHARYSYGWPGKISWKLSMKFPILALGKSKLFYILLPIYYLVTFPFCMVLNFLDVRLKHQTGTGLIVNALK